MKVRFWGVRGSFAMTGSAFLRYGGNTTAVEVANSNGQRLLIDLGTGATEFAKELMCGEFGKGQGHLPILLSHTHLDHIQGLPFFTPFFIKGNRIRIFGAQPPSGSLERVIQEQLNPHYSPLYGLQNLAAGVSIEEVSPDKAIPIDGFEVAAAAVPHGSLACLGFRIKCDGVVVTFLSDVEYPTNTPTQEALSLAADADLLIHDAMLSDDEYHSRHGWGHSPVSAAIAVAQQASVKRLALFHHSPDSTDDIIDSLAESARSECANRNLSIEVFAAAEGPVLDLP